MMLHEVMTAPVMSGFWVTEGLTQTLLWAKDGRVQNTQDKQTDNEENTKLLTNTKWSIFFTVTNQVKWRIQRFWCILTMFRWNLHRLSKIFLASWTETFRAICLMS
jgi:hypothetical protein